MNSVTGRIREIKQPRGGYIKPSQFTLTPLEDHRELAPAENVHASIVGMTVDYLSRFILGATLEDAFKISITGAKFATMLGYKNAQKEIATYLKGIRGLDSKSIINACKCTTFDVWFRNPAAAALSKRAADTMPDDDTVENIKIMVERSVFFFEQYGPIVTDGFTFEPDGYTATVSSGDGDFLTKDTLWDFKVSTSKPTSKHTLQLLMYWIMGQHSTNPIFADITKLGIFNPRLNTVYMLDMAAVPASIIKAVETDVICY